MSEEETTPSSVDEVRQKLRDFRGSTNYEPPLNVSTIPLRSGVHHELEFQADRILAEGRRGITSHTQMREQGYLSPSQLETRQMREIYVGVGTPEEEIVSGMTKRAYAPPRSKGPRETTRG